MKRQSIKYFVYINADLVENYLMKRYITAIPTQPNRYTMQLLIKCVTQVKLRLQFTKVVKWVKSVSLWSQ